jgi:hypothetical protein
MHMRVSSMVANRARFPIDLLDAVRDITQGIGGWLARLVGPYGMWEVCVTRVRPP